MGVLADPDLTREYADAQAADRIRQLYEHFDRRSSARLTAPHRSLDEGLRQLTAAAPTRACRDEHKLELARQAIAANDQLELFAAVQRRYGPDLVLLADGGAEHDRRCVAERRGSQPSCTPTSSASGAPPPAGRGQGSRPPSCSAWRPPCATSTHTSYGTPSASKRWSNVLRRSPCAPSSTPASR